MTIPELLIKALGGHTPIIPMLVLFFIYLEVKEIRKTLKRQEDRDGNGS